MEDIKDYRHTFGQMTVLINCKNGVWSAVPIKGNSGIGHMSGGSSKTLQEYISKVEREHRYAAAFFGSGGNHKLAKKAIE